MYRTANYYIHLSWIEANSNSQCEGYLVDYLFYVQTMVEIMKVSKN